MIIVQELQYILQDVENLKVSVNTLIQSNSNDISREQREALFQLYVELNSLSSKIENTLPNKIIEKPSIGKYIKSIRKEIEELSEEIKLAMSVSTVEELIKRKVAFRRNKLNKNICNIELNHLYKEIKREFEAIKYPSEQDKEEFEEKKSLIYDIRKNSIQILYSEEEELLEQLESDLENKQLIQEDRRNIEQLAIECKKRMLTILTTARKEGFTIKKFVVKK